MKIELDSKLLFAELNGLIYTRYLKSLPTRIMTQNPYLSVVVTARNDNHGGNMLRRMQIFVNGLLEQCRRHQLEAELIIVEWNPPGNRPPLAEALTWQIENSPCIVRFVEVPPHVHQQLNHSESLPLFQMIAKNVGIRRAKGEFVLATNIDLLFSDELFHFLALRQLQHGKIYRMDRYDVDSNVPLEASIEEQLLFCEKNILRINRKSGIEELQVELTSASVHGEESIQSTALEFPESATPPVSVEVASRPRWYRTVARVAKPILKQTRQVYKELLPVDVRDKILAVLPISFRHWLISRDLLNPQPVPPPPVEESVFPEQSSLEESFSEEPSVPLMPPLHTNACGDFTLMSLADWFAIRAYPEWEIFSFHLDSMLMFIAYYAGIEEVILEDPMRTYHIEHSSGWTPEAERSQTLNKRLKKLKIPQMSMEQLTALTALMQQLEKPLIFNEENWGMVNESLKETVMGVAGAYGTHFYSCTSL